MSINHSYPNMERNFSQIISWKVTQNKLTAERKKAAQVTNRKKTCVHCDSIIVDCIHLVSQFSSRAFSFVKHDCNMVHGHVVAKHTRTESWRKNLISGFRPFSKLIIFRTPFPGKKKNQGYRIRTN